MKGYYWVKGASEYRCPDKQLGQKYVKVQPTGNIEVGVNNSSTQNNKAIKVNIALKQGLSRAKTNFENEFLKK